MIINIRGSHGSGKSTLVYALLGYFDDVKAKYKKPRRRPVGYTCTYKGEPVWVVGAYESPTGGCDTIPKVEDIYNAIARHAKRGEHVVFEGILAQHSTQRLLDLTEQHDVIVVALTTTLKKCVRSVEKRRAARGETRPVNVGTIEREFRAVTNSVARLQAAGVRIKWCNRASALEFCLAKLDP